MRARLAGDFEHASGWVDLDTRLKAKGFALRAAGGGLALYRWPDDTRLCKASDLGFSYARLMHRFRAPFPGHPHAWLARRLLTPETQTAPPPEGDGAEDDFDVIERF